MWIRHLIFAGCSAPAVLRAAWRVRRSVRRLALDELAEELRRVPPFRWSYLGRPDLLCSVTNRLLRWLPPRSYGRCMRRSLILLDLWSRCGLSPRLHLGVQKGADVYQGHAWVTGEAEGGAKYETSAMGFPQAFEL